MGIKKTLATLVLSGASIFSGGCSNESSSPIYPQDQSVYVTNVTRSKNLPSLSPPQESADIDNLMVSEEERVLTNLEALSKEIPKGFVKEIRGNDTIYHDRGIEISPKIVKENLWRLRGAGKAVILMGDSQVIAGVYNNELKRKNTWFPDWEGWEDVYVFQYDKEKNLFDVTTHAANFTYQEGDSGWIYRQVYYGKLKDDDEFVKTLMVTHKPWQFTNKDLAKMPLRFQEVDSSKLKRYQEIVKNLMTNYAKSPNADINISP